MAPALLAFNRSTAGSNGTDSAAPAIENLPQPSVLPFCHQADAAGRQAEPGVAHADVPVRAATETPA
ncbi:hypothetical protein XarjCFBP7652_06260 [Xanthomonas arboricola]|nr:hypothetical protein XarjCFBP7652_06260 [Xanthomonas arboricola]